MMTDKERTRQGGAGQRFGGFRKALVTAASVAVVAGAGVGIALAQQPAPGGKPPAGCGHRQHDGGGRGHDWRHGYMAGYMARELNLTDEQKQQIRDISQQSRAEGAALRGQFGDMRKELHDLVTSGKYSDDQARAIAKKYESAFVDLTVRTTGALSKVRDVLTPEQQAKADEMALKRGARGGFMGPMGPPDDGMPPEPPAN